MTVRPITTGANSEMNQSDFLAVTLSGNLLKAREKSRVQGASGFACHRSKKVARDFLADHQA